MQNRKEDAKCVHCSVEMLKDTPEYPYALCKTCYFTPDIVRKYRTAAKTGEPVKKDVPQAAPPGWIFGYTPPPAPAKTDDADKTTQMAYPGANCSPGKVTVVEIKPSDIVDEEPKERKSFDQIVVNSAWGRKYADKKTSEDLPSPASGTFIMKTSDTLRDSFNKGIKEALYGKSIGTSYGPTSEGPEVKDAHKPEQFDTSKMGELLKQAHDASYWNGTVQKHWSQSAKDAVFLNMSTDWCNGVASLEKYHDQASIEKHVAYLAEKLGDKFWKAAAGVFFNRNGKDCFINPTTPLSDSQSKSLTEMHEELSKEVLENGLKYKSVETLKKDDELRAQMAKLQLMYPPSNPDLHAPKSITGLKSIGLDYKEKAAAYKAIDLASAYADLCVDRAVIHKLFKEQNLPISQELASILPNMPVLKVESPKVYDMLVSKLKAAGIDVGSAGHPCPVDTSVKQEPQEFSNRRPTYNEYINNEGHVITKLSD